MKRRVPSLPILRHAGRIAVAALALIVAGHPRAIADTLVLQGSSTFNATLAQSLAKAVEAETGHTLEIFSNRSNIGLLAALEGKADLAMLSTGLEKEIDLVRGANPHLPFERLRAFEIGSTRAALVVHPENPVRRATLDEIGRILSGALTNWSELGGPDLPIRIVANRDGGGVLASVEAQLLGSARMSAPNQIRVQIGTQVVRVVAQEPGALGLTQLSHARDANVRELATDLAIVQKLSLVTLGEPTTAARAIIDAMRRLALSAP